MSSLVFQLGSVELEGEEVFVVVPEGTWQCHHIVTGVLLDLFVNLLVLSEVGAPDVDFGAELVSQVTERQRHPGSVDENHGRLLGILVAELCLDRRDPW